MSSQDPAVGPESNSSAEPPELDINGNPIPAKNLFAAPASADTPPPEKTPPTGNRPPSTLRPLSGDPRRGSGPPPNSPDSVQPSSDLLGVEAGYDLAGNPLPANAPSAGSGLYTARPVAPGAGARGTSPHGLDPTGGAGYGRRYTTTVNGGLILALGILGLVCPVLAPIAWVMGNNAIGAISRGDANPAPRGQANTGRICGIIGSVLIIFFLGLDAALSVLTPGFSPFHFGNPTPSMVPAPAHAPTHVPLKSHMKHHHT